MSDLVVVEQQGATVIVQEVPAANIVEVVAAGPQGAQGAQGEKGDMGDVTPAALAAKTAAETAATSATSSATSASTSAGQAATAASTATTKASEASASASSAAGNATAAAGSATSAATSASTATTKASEASASATSASTSASNAATSASTATTKASEAATSATNAASSASTATTKASEASTSATNAANSATSAATSATSASGSASTATTKASEAAGSASSAATSASTASTKATEASGSATTASTAATTATTQAGIATTKAGEAATSATNAAASAATATTQASNAAASATAAGAAKTGAESARDSAVAAYANFVDQYLGPKSSDPTTDNTSGALAAGNLYFNTNSLASGGGMKVYDGTTWLAAYASLSGALVASNNLSDLANASAARTNIGLGNVENKSSTTIRSELTSGNVTTALGFTPYNATNPAGYITSSALSGYLTSAAAASTYLPLAGGTLTGDLTFSGTNRRIIGDFTSTTRLLVQTNVANSNTVFGLIPSGTAVNSQFHVWGAADITNAPLGAFTINSAQVQIQSTAAGTGTVLPFRVLVGITEVFRATTAANFLIGTSTDDGANKLQVSGSVSATSFAGSGANLTGFTSGQITTALGFTPYNATNPSGYTSNVGDVTLTGTQTLTNKTLTSPTLNTATASGLTLNAGYTEAVFAITGTTPALSPTNGSIQTWTLTANSTPTAGTWAAGQSITLMVNDSASSFTVTWTSLPVVWVGGSAPTLAPASGNTVIVLWKVGTTIYGALTGQAA